MTFLLSRLSASTEDPAILFGQSQILDATVMGAVLRPTWHAPDTSNAWSANSTQSVLQRVPAKPQSKSQQGTQALRADASVLAMHIGMLFGPTGRSYGPADAEGLSDWQVAFLKHLYHTLFERRFGAPDEVVREEELEVELAGTKALMPMVAMELSLDAESAQVLSQLNARLSKRTEDVTMYAITARAMKDAELEAQLISRAANDARESLLAGLKKGEGVYVKFAELLEQAPAPLVDQKLAVVALKDVDLGLRAAIKVAKAVDPDSYRQAVAEAREWCDEHHAGVGLRYAKSAQVTAEMVELTLGTLNTVAKTLSKIAISAFLPTGATLKTLEELAESGKLVSSGGAVALRVGKVLETLEKFEIALNAFAVAGGVGKFITAETRAERVDAAIEAGTAGLQIVGKVAGRAALGSAATSVLVTYELVKFSYGMGAGAIEGSMFGGLWQELDEIELKGDSVARTLVSLGRAIDERDSRFANLDVLAPGRAGANEAVDKLAYLVQTALRKADRRWRDSRIRPLADDYPAETQVSVGQALQDGYPPELVAAAGIEFMKALSDAYHDAPGIVADMMEGDYSGYMSKEMRKLEAERLRKKVGALGKSTPAE